jgi:hypothetical protein
VSCHKRCHVSCVIVIVMCHVSHVSCIMVMCHASCIMCHQVSHMSCVMCHSPVINMYHVSCVIVPYVILHVS